MGKQDKYIRTTFRLPPELHEWLLQQDSMNATAIEAIERLKAARESEDAYSVGFADGYAKGKNEKKD